MTTMTEVRTLTSEDLSRFLALRDDAARTVAKRFISQDTASVKSDAAIRLELCMEDAKYHLEFLRPALEFSILQPMIDYLRWLNQVLSARSIDSQQDVALSLDWLAEYFVEHMNGDGGRIVAEALHQARDGFLEPSPDTDVVIQSPQAWPEAADFEEALLSGEHRKAQEIINQCNQDGKVLVDIEMHIIQPSLYSIGEKWQSNQVSVAQEHLATSIAESVMSTLLMHATQPAPTGRRALLACVEENHHTVGLRMVAHALLLDGWDVLFLGANVPTKSLVQQIKDWEPDLVGLSLSFAQHLPAVKSVITQLNEIFGLKRPAILIGGLAINKFERISDAVGADAFGSNASAALTSANKILSDRVRV